ncbi:hypothetical protein JQ633_32260 [Bradyrhizobium tropiciagri]|uniref:hypothetical protein n=1 Tax=Bradyrhizobium tropiciagri TaxID=312253 RepID=UPI001BAB13F8|nr:hypothetical protein [Bradyrhizobium tropiciagri]MBR0875071.1 hypothetical protein [Bradyrhizobium tropiciagri]
MSPNVTAEPDSQRRLGEIEREGAVSRAGTRKATLSEMNTVVTNGETKQAVTYIHRECLPFAPDAADPNRLCNALRHPAQCVST